MTGISVFGAGYLGNRISQELGAELVPRSSVDLLDIKQIRNYLQKHNPQVVINCAGKTSGPGAIGIDWCELHKTETIQGNIVAPINLASACKDLGIYFVHIGSGCVYAGDNSGKGFSEKDAPNFYGPQFYSMTKIDSERILQNIGGLILRIRMPIDDRPHPRNLINKLASYPSVIDIQNSMTTVPDMIRSMKTLIEARATGIYNVTNPGTISAAEIMHIYQQIVDPNHKFDVMTLNQLDAVTLGKRSNCVLDSSKIENAGAGLPPMHEAVKECLVRYSKALKS
jgi:dTDP-4-dehydrorhamnose reductase